MMAQALEYLQDLLLPIVVAIVAAWVTVRLSLRRFRTERWWELKAETYMGIMDALYVLKRDFWERLGEEFLDDPIGEEEMDSWLDEWEDARENVFKISAHGTFLVHENAIKALDRVINELAMPEPPEKKLLISDNLERKNFFFERSLAIQQAIAEIIVIAKKDLRIRY